MANSLLDPGQQKNQKQNTRDRRQERGRPSRKPDNPQSPPEALLKTSRKLTVKIDEPVLADQNINSVVDDSELSQSVDSRTQPTDRNFALGDNSLRENQYPIDTEQRPEGPVNDSDSMLPNIIDSDVGNQESVDQDNNSDLSQSGHQNPIDAQQRPEGQAGNADSTPLSRDDLKNREAANPYLSRAMTNKKNKNLNETKKDDVGSSSTSNDTSQSPNSSPSGVPRAERSLYKPSSGQPGKLNIGSLFNTRRRKIITSGGIASIILGGIFGFLSLLPLRLANIMNNVQDHFFAVAQSAVTTETNTLFSNYIKKTVIPSLELCRSAKGGIHSTSDINCTSGTAGDTYVRKLYRGWAQGRLENKLATKYGIEFSYDPDSRTNYMKTPGMNGNGVDIKDFINGSDNLDNFIAKNDGFKKFDRQSIRQAIKLSVRDETLVKKGIVRFRLALLLKQKYGIKFCIVACKTKDTFDDWKDKKVIAAKMLFAQRILEPNSEFFGVLIQCVLTASCNPTADDPPSTDNNPTKYENGQCQEGCTNGPISKTDDQLRRKLFTLGLSKNLSTSDVVDLYEKYKKHGFKSYVGETLVTKSLEIFLDSSKAKKGGEVTGKILAADIPYIGEIYLAGQMITAIDKGGPIIAKYSYLTDAAAMASVFAMYRIYADEIKNGSVDATMVGSFNDSFGSGPQCPDGGGFDKNSKCSNGEEQLGGTAQAEETPLYNYLTSGDSKTTTLSNLISAKAYASSAVEPSPDYICQDGKPVPVGRLICNEEFPNQPNRLQPAHDFLHSNPIISATTETFETFTNIANAASSLVCKIGICDAFALALGTIGNLAKNIPGVDQLLGALTTAVKDYVLPPSPMGTANSGGRTFNMVAGGGDIVANDLGHNGIGGQLLTNDEVVQIRNQYLAEAKQEFDSQPFLSRMFDKNSQYSLVSKLAMAMPTNTGQLGSSLASLVRNPIGALANLPIPLTSKAFAASGSSLAADPFGIAQYGYRNDDPIFSQDPEQYWDTNCADGAKTLEWNKQATQNLDPNNYTPVNTTTNGCLLIEAAASSAGGAFTDDVLSPEQRAESVSGTSN